MRIAFVQQPIGHLLLPAGDRPLRSNSTGIWTYEMAVRCAGAHQVSVFGLNPDPGDVAKNHRGVRFHFLDSAFDLWRLELAARVRRKTEPIGWRRTAARPYFLSYLYFARYSLRAALAIRRQRSDVIHLANFPQFAPIFRHFNPEARIILHMHCDWLRQLDPSLLDPFLSAVDLISGCSRYIAAAVPERFPRHAGKAFHLYNGVDSEFFRPSAPLAASPELLYVGRVSPEKGIHVLLGAFARVARRIPDLRLTLVGNRRSIPLEYLVAIDQDPLVRRLVRFYSADPTTYQRFLDVRVEPELADRVTFVPPCPQQELLPFYQRATLFVSPSICGEAFGMPIAEAMSCGIPVVATRAGGIPEVVADGLSGILVEREGEEALAEAIHTLLSDPAQRRRMGEAGRNRVKENFTWDLAAHHFQEILEERLCGKVVDARSLACDGA